MNSTEHVETDIKDSPMRSGHDNKPWRWLAVAVMFWSGWLTTMFAYWLMGIPNEDMGMHHAAAITGFTGGIAAIFKFAFDFALDGQSGR